MESQIKFRFDGKLRDAVVHASLQEDGCFIFSILKDQELVEKFGLELDFETECEKVTGKRMTNDELFNLATAKLEPLKSVPEFLRQKTMLINQTKRS